MPKKHNAGGCGCCGEQCVDCSDRAPRKMTVRLSNGDPVPTSLHYSAPCEWHGTTGARTYTFTLVEVAGNLTARVTLDNAGDETVWELDVEALVPVVCCTDLDGLVLDCVSSDEDYCTDSVTCIIGAICSDISTYGCSLCPDYSPPEYLRVVLDGFIDWSAGICHMCASWNGTYFVPLTDTGTGPCTWILEDCLDSCLSKDTGDIWVYTYNTVSWDKGLVICYAFACWKSRQSPLNTIVSVCDGLWGCGDLVGATYYGTPPTACIEAD